MDEATKRLTIQANLNALCSLLQDAAALTEEACSHMAQDEQNMAFGTLVGLEEKLASAQHLFGAAAVLHRQ